MTFHGVDLERVATYYGCTVAEMVGPRRFARVAWPRQVVVYLACRRGASLQAAAALVGRTDHSTAWYARRHVEALMAAYPEVQTDVEGAEEVACSGASVGPRTRAEVEADHLARALDRRPELAGRFGLQVTR